MRSNFKAICIASTEWKSEFEGILLMKDKKNNYSEHWCRLKGNLLVFCKNNDRKCEEIFGIIILEYFSIETVNDTNAPNSFKLVFGSGDSPIVLATKSKEEYCSWKQHISEARCNSFTQKIQALKEEVNLLQKQLTDIEPVTKNEEFVDEAAHIGDKSRLTISLSCENLPHYSIETDPNPSISVFICNLCSKEEKLHSTTEIVQNSRNPQFHKIISIPEDLFDSNIQIKFIVFDIRDIESNTKHKIGSSAINANLLLNNSNLMVKLNEQYGQNVDSILRIKVQRCRTSVTQTEVNVHIIESSVSKNTMKYTKKRILNKYLPEDRSYYSMTENNLKKFYNFPNRQSKDLRITEMMGESKFGLLVPIEYLKRLFEEDSLILESLSKFGSNSTQLEKLRTDRHLCIRENMRKCEDLLSFMSLSCAEDKKFHPSSKKRELESSFIPLNLHINRIQVEHSTTHQMTKHLDVISVGAFTSHYLKFKNGGLIQLAKNLPEGLNKNSSMNTANLLLRQYVHLYQDLSDQIKHLCSFTILPEDIKEDLYYFEIKMVRFHKFFQHQFFTCLSLDQVLRDYQQLTHEMREFIEGRTDTTTSIKLIHAGAHKFEQSMESINLMVYNLLWPKILHALNNEMINLEWTEFCFRENIAFSQALGAVISGIALACNIWTPVQWSQMIICGIPLYFEGLLTSYGDEAAMIEDMKWVIDKLVDFTVIIKPDIKAPAFNLTSLNRVEISCFLDSWKNAPIEIRMKKQIKLHLHPYFLNVGINEQQTIADKISKNNLISTINMSGYESMRAYFERHVKNIGDSLQTCQGAEIIDCLNDLLYEIRRNKNKPVKILRIAERISWAWGAIRFTSCKSAKDRTGMALSLEQVRWLKHVAGMKEDYFTKALECIRSIGLRRDNCYKNINSSKYAFNSLQLLSFPKNYKAPVGTYGSNES